MVVVGPPEQHAVAPEALQGQQVTAAGTGVPLASGRLPSGKESEESALCLRATQ